MRTFLRGLAAEGRAVLVSSHLMSELQDTADHLVVAGRGQVIADTSVAALIAAASGDRVRLRTTARADAMRVLANAGAEVAATAQDVLTIAGLSSERVVATLTAHHVPFAEVSAHRATLEEAYMELTRDAVEFHSAGQEMRPGGGVVMTTIAPYRSPAAPGKNGFAQALRAELTKFRTVRGWIIGALVGVLVMAGVGLLASAGGQSSCQAVGAPTGSGSSGQLRLRHLLHPRPERRAGVRQLLLRPPAARRRRQHHRPADLADRPPPVGQQWRATDNVPGVVAWAKAGLIIKENLTQGSAYAAIMVAADHGVRLQWNYTGDTAGLPGTVGPANPRWLRLTRSGDVITGYDSADGTTLVAGRHGDPGRPPVDRAGRPVRHVPRRRPARRRASAAAPATRRRPHPGHGGLRSPRHVRRLDGRPVGRAVRRLAGNARGRRISPVGRPVHPHRTGRHRADPGRARRPGGRRRHGQRLPRRHVRRPARDRGGRRPVRHRRVPARADPADLRGDAVQGPGARGQVGRGRRGRLHRRAARRRR